MVRCFFCRVSQVIRRVIRRISTASDYSTAFFLLIITQQMEIICRNSTIISLLKKKKTTLRWSFFLAEKEGFEPSIPFWGIHDFQSCALGQLRDFSKCAQASLNILLHKLQFVKPYFNQSQKILLVGKLLKIRTHYR